MNPIDAIVGWTLVNLALAGGAVVGIGAWLLYVSLAAHARRWWRRLAPKPTRRQEKETPMGWLVHEGGVGTHAPTLAEAHARLDHMLARLADDRMLRELEAEFNREQQA